MHDFNLIQTFIHETTAHTFEIRWTRVGDEKLPPLVFIHGTPWCSAEWHDLAAALSSRFNIYLYDHPGFNHSPSPHRLTDAPEQNMIDLDGPLTLRAEASAALFRHWNFETRPHVAAHDNGGLVSLRLLLEHDISFASLCLMDVVALGPFGLPFFKLVAENESVFAAIPPNITEGFVRGYEKRDT
ncbi:alpha/beta-hydrolase [Tothia fuscella]|uniref:Alpha/beta-hydrolase n=1 Tax=Tothia fuscella TaxID=1048955 RepID=A0A9P4NJ62_9PEZI|nr:alpha/beta-hydrolase [Tothia fuscella]